jgi:hypothetical protein
MAVMVATEQVERAIFIVRGRRVILDSELAALYGVPVKRLNEQVKRNIGRFPEDFAFQLTREEVEILKSQIATSRSTWGGSRKPPTAFTEHGAVMAASVLNSPKAVEMSVEVVRAFVRLRQILSSNRQLAAKVEDLERKLAAHDKTLQGHHGNIRSLFMVIENLMPGLSKRQIGFRAQGERKKLPPAKP